MKEYLQKNQKRLPLNLRLYGFAVEEKQYKMVRPIEVRDHGSVIRMRSHFHKPIGTWLRLTLST